MTKIFFLILLALPMTLAASEGGHHAIGEIPWKAIFYQCLNFFLLIGILVYFLKDKVRDSMKSRHELLAKAVHESQQARRAAEDAKKEIGAKLKDFEAENKKLIERVKTDGVALHAKIKAEAQKSAQNLEAEAHRMIENEMAKAKEKILEDVTLQALDGARGLLSQSVEEPDQRRLQKEFVKKIEAVQ